MEMEKTQASVVIIARQFNPSIISQYWLIKNNILTEEEFEVGSIFSPVMVNIQSKKCDILILPDQLQFIPKTDSESEQELVTSKLGNIIKLLPHTPFVAAGLNFSWHIRRDDISISALSWNLFFREGSPLYLAFNTEDAHFGAYMSKDVIGCRLKLDVKPVTINLPEAPIERLQFAFNFHLQLAEDNKVDDILCLLSKWNEARERSSAMVKSVTDQDS